MSQSWNPVTYASDARFVSDLGADALDLLRPRSGERVLDLGCGDGTLTMHLLEWGCEVVGIDASPEMIEAAVARGLDARVMDAHALPFHEEFDAVFSNAALHWMTRPRDVISGVHRALKPGGRFVGEFGGDGNIAVIVQALASALELRGLTFDRINPWYFPTADEYGDRLRSASMLVSECRLIARPTPISTDLVSWLAVFAQPFLKSLPESGRDGFLDQVSTMCRAELQQPDGAWHLDYVRLRFAAMKGRVEHSSTSADD